MSLTGEEFVTSTGFLEWLDDKIINDPMIVCVIKIYLLI